MPTERASAVTRRAEAPRDDAPQVPALTLAGASRRYGTVEALAPVTLAIASGERVAIVVKD